MNFSELLIIYSALIATGNKDLASQIAWVKNVPPERMQKEALGWSLETVEEFARNLLLPIPFRYDEVVHNLMVEKNGYRCIVSAPYDDRERYKCGFSEINVRFEVAVYQKYKAGKKSVPFSGQWVDCKKSDKGAELKWVDYDDFEREVYYVNNGDSCNSLKQDVMKWWKSVNKIKF